MFYFLAIPILFIDKPIETKALEVTVVINNNKDSEVFISEWNRTDWPLRYHSLFWENNTNIKIVHRLNYPKMLETYPCMIIGKSIIIKPKPEGFNYSGSSIEHFSHKLGEYCTEINKVHQNKWRDFGLAPEFAEKVRQNSTPLLDEEENEDVIPVFPIP